VNSREDGMHVRNFLPSILLVLLAFVSLLPAARAESCKAVVHGLNRQFSPGIDEQELTTILETLNDTGNERLPSKFVTKKQAKEQGWTPGKDLWSMPALRGCSMGGDRFGNREGRLPRGRWREADLDYRGGHRGSKRLIFSDDGRRFVTVDHYRTFTEVPPCR
jgi:ribonuclease T1